MSKISIIGSGVVGERVGCGFECLGNMVIFYDIDKKKISNLAKEHKATTNINEAILGSDISFVCVPTPYTTHSDNRYIISAVKSIVSVLKKKKEYHVIVIKSTVSPTTTEKIVVPLTTLLKKNVGVCMNPEFLTENSCTWTDDKKYTRDFFTEDRIVIGESDTRAGDILEELYRPLHKPIFRTDLTTAEIIKFACNCALAARISYWNELFLICKSIGVDGRLVAQIARLDERIGVYGSHPGQAFGGKCLPKDLKAMISFSEQVTDIPLLKAIDRINEEMKNQYGVLG